MTEYIERESVLEIIRKQSVGTYRGEPCYPDEISRTFREVRKIPAADVAPVVRGKWIHSKFTPHDQCSICEKWVPTMQNFKYCPNCGAKMEG